MSIPTSGRLRLNVVKISSGTSFRSHTVSILRTCLRYLTQNSSKTSPRTFLLSRTRISVRVCAGWVYHFWHSTRKRSKRLCPSGRAVKKSAWRSMVSSRFAVSLQSILLEQQRCRLVVGGLVCFGVAGIHLTRIRHALGTATRDSRSNDDVSRRQ